MLVAEDVCFAYGETQVLRGVSLDVAPGEVVALLGPSGSGKSTFLYCLAGVLVPTGGRVCYDGLDIAGGSDRERTAIRREHFGFVLQFGRLVADLTAVENASFPLRLLGVPRAEAEQRGLAALAVVGLDSKATRRAASLSGGEQQRVAVARALVHGPGVVFADEPTGALDSTNGALVMDCLTSAARDLGAAVVLVTHDESVAQQADRRVYLSDGHLADHSMSAIAGVARGD